MVAFEHIRDIIRRHGGELTYGTEEDVESLADSGKRLTCRWVLVPIGMSLVDYDVMHTFTTARYRLMGLWLAGTQRTGIVEEIMGKVRRILAELANTPRPATLAALDLPEQANIDWDGRVLVVALDLAATIMEG